MVEERYFGSLDDLYRENRDKGGFFELEILTEHLKPKDGETSRRRCVTVKIPHTPLAREVLRLTAESGQNVYHLGDQQQYIPLHDGKSGKALNRKHGQDYLIHHSREAYTMIWLGVLAHHHQLKWRLDAVYHPAILDLYKPYIDLHVAELELWRQVRNFDGVKAVFDQTTALSGHELWFLTSNEWQTEHCVMSLCEISARKKRQLWAQRASAIGEGFTFFGADNQSQFRAILVNACIHIQRNHSEDSLYQDFLRKGWQPYIDAMKNISKATRHGVDFHGEMLHYPTPIINGLHITTSEDKTIKIPLGKPDSKLTKRGKYTR